MTLLTVSAAWAVIIPAFWARWLSVTRDPADHPVGYESHETSFVLPDSVLAVLLAACAISLATGTDVIAGRIGLIAGGMMLFLGLIDLAYDLRKDSSVEELGVDVLLLVSAVSIIALAWEVLS